MVNAYFEKKKVILTSKIKSLVALTLNKIVGLFHFLNLNKFLFVLLDLLPSITLFCLAIFINISKFFDKLIILSINISGLAILLNL